MFILEGCRVVLLLLLHCSSESVRTLMFDSPNLGGATANTHTHIHMVRKDLFGSREGLA